MNDLKTTAMNMNNNIFNSSLAGSKAIMQKRVDVTRKKNIKKTYLYFSFTILLLVTYSVSFLYPQLNLFFNASENIQIIQNESSEYEKVILEDLKKERDMHKSAYSKEYKDVEDIINKIFPTAINRLGIVKRLENFATSTNTKAPPFEFNSITFAAPEVKDEYIILPISTSIHSSTINFDRFLNLINLSGRLDSGIPIRLMEISNININYRGIDQRTGEDKGVDFSVKLNAYSRIE